jgi:hypothetical protein
MKDVLIEAIEREVWNWRGDDERIIAVALVLGMDLDTIRRLNGGEL